MPIYTYFCEENGQTVEVSHTMEARLNTWGELCYVSRLALGDTDPLAPVKRLIKTAPAVSVPVFNSELKNSGFTKLVKREQGVYENVTATGDEKRYMKAGDKDSVPHFHKKIGD
ncbi:MAG: zinc ribbon domain-containing protein [Gammaproteobacteria bacterium]